MESRLKVFYSSPVEQLYENIDTCVAEPFERGLSSFLNLIEAIDKVDESLDAEEVSQNLLTIATGMVSNFARAKNAAVNRESCISARMEKLKHRQLQIETELEQTEDCLIGLTFESDYLEFEAEKAQRELCCDEQKLEEAEAALSRAEREVEEKRKTQLKVLAAAIPISVIPFVGWVVGPTMSIIAATALDKDVKLAAELRDIANSKRRERHTECENKTRELKEIQNELQKKRREYADKQREQDQLRQDIQREKRHYEHVSRLSDSFRRIVSMISLTKGRSVVLKEEIRNMYSLLQLEGPFQELSQLLCSGQSRRVCQLLSDRSKMKRLESKLRALSYRLKVPCTYIASTTPLLFKGKPFTGFQV